MIIRAFALLRCEFRILTAMVDCPYTRVMVARQRQGLVHQLARILASMDEPQVPHLLAVLRAGIFVHATADQSNRTETAQIEEPESFGPRANTRTWSLDIAATGAWWRLTLKHRRAQWKSSSLATITQEAIAFASTRCIFDVRELPGNLSEEERVAIGESLEETGLFRRIQK